MTEQPTAQPFTRCPDCGCVYWPPAWDARHRPSCTRKNDNPETWRTKP